MDKDRTTTEFDYDLIVLGSGPAGIACALQSSKFGKKVMIVEERVEKLGGTWIHTGTVPSKALRQAAKTIHLFHSQYGDEQGRRPFEKFRMEDLLRYKQSKLETKNKQVFENLKKNEIHIVRGTGALKDAHQVIVSSPDGKKSTYSGENLLISTGSRPKPFHGSYSDEVSLLDYESILNLTHIPRKLAIIGGGVNAFEYAAIFSSLGTRVSLLNEKDQYLPFLDNEIYEHLQRSNENRQIAIHNGVAIEDIRSNGLRNTTEVCFRTKSEDRLQVIETEHILTFSGFTPNTKGIGLEGLGVRLDNKGFIKVDDRFKTEIPSIYAAGDVIGPPNLASVSFFQGRLTACNMFDQPVSEVHNKIPYTIYTIPEIAAIGLTEKEAAEEGLDFTVGRAYYSNVTQAEINNFTEGILKLVFDTESLKLLGVHIFGDGATELIHLGQSIMSFNGDIRYFTDNVLNYPSYTEAYRIAAFNGINRVHQAGVKYRKETTGGK